MKQIKYILAGLFLMAFMAMQAQAQIGAIPRYGNVYLGPGNSSATNIGFISNLVITNVQYIPIYKGAGIRLWFKGCTATNPTDTAGTALITLQVTDRSGSTNWAGHSPQLQWSVPTGKTCNFYKTTNFPADVLDNAKFLRVYAITNQFTNQLWITNMTWSAIP